MKQKTFDDATQLVRNQREEAKADALASLVSIVREFPGLINDTEVNGADLVDALTRTINDSDTLKAYLSNQVSK